MLDELAAEHRTKATTIFQSVVLPEGDAIALGSGFNALLIANLREVKDPLRAAFAVRRFPEESQLTVLHLGAIISPEYEHQARDEMQSNKRYQWLGARSRTETLAMLRSADVLIVSSLFEGGPNVISEAIVLRGSGACHRHSWKSGASRRFVSRIFSRWR